MNLESNVSLVSKLLNNPKFRDAFVFEHIKNGVAFQMEAMRDDRDWTQAKLGEMAKKPRTVITRIEDPNYGQFSIQTLREIAAAFNVGLLVKFVPFSRLLEEYDDVSPAALAARSINDPKEVRRLKRWAAAKDKAEQLKDLKETPAHTLHLAASNGAGGNMLFLDKVRKGQRNPPKTQIDRPTFKTVTTAARVFRLLPEAPHRKAS